MTQDQESLARLTLRQLRVKASELSVPLYSRKTKSALVREISLFQKKQSVEKQLINPLSAAKSRLSKEGYSSGFNTDTRVVFLPRDPQWSYVFWEISESDRKKALSQGASRLCLRLVDVTGLQAGEAHRQTLQEVPVDSHSTEWYLPIPMSDRDYIVELGYKFGNRWSSLAVSSAARVPSLQPSEQVLDQFVPFSLDANQLTSSESEILVNEPKDIGLHERLYQTATAHFGKTRIGSEEFMDRDSIPSRGLSDSGVGLWASGRNDSGVGGVLPRKRSFWLVADAELIVYGSTDPSAKLKIGGEDIPLSKDGTFRLQVPFRDGVQNYPIEATVQEGDQIRNITMKFERTTLEDNTNPNDQAQDEWF